MKQVIIFWVCFGAASLQKFHFLNILEPKDKIFDTVNSDIYATLNKIFNSLKLDKTITHSANIQMLVMLNYHYYKIADKNNKIYAELRNISVANCNTSHNTDIIEIFSDTVKEQINNIKNNIANVTNTLFATEITNNKTESNVSEETLEDFKEIWSILSDRTIESLIDPILNETELPTNAEYSLYANNKTREIKAWTPPSPDEEGLVRFNARRIYKGKKTKIKSFPFMVSIHIMSEFMCAGSIISKDMVITAASCLQTAYKNKLYRDNPRTIFVRVASDYTKRSGELIPVVKVFFHPQYSPVTLRNNVAIVKMLENIKHIKKRKIKRIKYDRKAETLNDDGTEVTILGWGAKDEKHLKPSNFQKLAVADLDIYDLNDCKEVYSKYYVTDTNFCAGFSFKGGGACMGDVGGPAVIAGELVGIISFGPTVCGLTDAPTVFTKVGFYAQWIDEVLSQKPVQKLREMATTTTTMKSPKLFIVPLYTTRTLSTHNTLQKRVTKGAKLRAKQTPDYPEEVQFLKKIIQEYILTNSSVVDYLLNGDILEDEEEEFKITTEKTNLFLDPAKYKVNDAISPLHSEKPEQFDQNFYKPIPGRTTKLRLPQTTTSNTTSSLSILRTVSHIEGNRPMQSVGFLRTTQLLPDYETDDLRKKTTFQTLYESSECSDDDDVFSDSNAGKVLREGESSSYYEQEIPIEAAEFRSQDDQIIPTLYTRANTRTTLKDQWPKVTRLLTNEELKMNVSYDPNKRPKHVVMPISLEIEDKGDNTDEIIHFEGITNHLRTTPSTTTSSTRKPYYFGTTTKMPYYVATTTKMPYHVPTTTKIPYHIRPTSRIPNPVGVSMSISDEDFEYMDNDRKKQDTDDDGIEKDMFNDKRPLSVRRQRINVM